MRSLGPVSHHRRRARPYASLLPTPRCMRPSLRNGFRGSLSLRCSASSMSGSSTSSSWKTPSVLWPRTNSVGCPASTQGRPQGRIFPRPSSVSLRSNPNSAGHMQCIAQGGVQARDKPLDPAASAAILKSLRKIALGLAMAKFDWKAGANNQAAEAAILRAMERQGKSMDRETLHRLLYEAERELRT